MYFNFGYFYYNEIDANILKKKSNLKSNYINQGMLYVNSVIVNYRNFSVWNFNVTYNNLVNNILMYICVNKKQKYMDNVIDYQPIYSSLTYYHHSVE